MFARRFPALLAALGASSLLVVACGGGSEETGPRRPVIVHNTGTPPSTTAPKNTTSMATATTFPDDGTGTFPGGSLVGGDPDGSSSDTTTPLGPPFDVRTGTVTFTDSTRPTPARGSEDAKPGRTMPTTMYVPVGRSEAPMLVFGIGFNASAATYDSFLKALASHGYMVAVPEFPLATSTLPGAPSQEDLGNQPADVSFVITSLIELAKRDGFFYKAIDANRIGVIGQSDGGNTVSAIALNACCLDERVRAVVSLAGEKAFLPDTWSGAAGVPYLAVHGTADTITPYVRSEELYALAGSPKFLVSIDGADHLGPVQDGTLMPEVAKLVAAFFDFYVDAKSDAFDDFTTGAVVPPFRLQQG